MIASSSSEFQSTLPRRERQSTDHIVSDILYFNPRSREGSDRHPSISHPVHPGISIHAPAKGATVEKKDIMRAFVFQSTLPRRERLCSNRSKFQTSDFNPRSREGSDVIARSAYCEDWNISIHAPAKGATDATLEYVKTAKFQSTLPRRERLIAAWTMLPRFYFNPRSREGSDTKQMWFFS